LINQRSPILNKHIQDFGCLFLCYLEIARQRIDAKWTDEIINILYQHFVASGSITARCSVNRPDSILVGLGVKLKGWIRRESVEYITRMDEEYIQEWHNPRTGLTHFVLPDYDPLGDSITVKEGKMISKIVVRFAG
jgi:hypothetical protein